MLECINHADDMLEEHFKLFGVTMEPIYTGNDDSLKCYFKDLESPLMRRPNHICGFFKMNRNISLIIFDDGIVWLLDNEDNKGIVMKSHLKLPFDKVVTV